MCIVSNHLVQCLKGMHVRDIASRNVVMNVGSRSHSRSLDVSFHCLYGLDVIEFAQLDYGCFLFYWLVKVIL